MRTMRTSHNKQNNDKEENKGWLAILLLQLLQTYAATCGWSFDFLAIAGCYVPGAG